MTDILPPRLILFDGICNLCNSSVLFIISHDPHAYFSFASLQSDTGQRILSSYGLPRSDFDSFIYVKDGKLYDRSTAALHVLYDLGGLWRIIYVFIIIPRPFRDIVYDFIAKYRYAWFGKRDSCMLPTPELTKRFIA